jgi:2-oxoisovalerate dehydrogenase E1 component
MAAARVNGRVCTFLEPIALYMTKDLHEEGDALWRVPYSVDSEHIPVGSGRTWREGEDLTIISWANGLWMSLRVAQRLEREHGIQAQVFDLRWLNPLPKAQMLQAAKATGKVLVVDETRATGGVSEGILASLIDSGFVGPMKRVAAWDAFIPLGEAANRVLVQEEDIEAAALALLGRAK